MATLAFAISAFSAGSPAGSINFVNAPVNKVLPVYQALSGGQIIQSSEVKRMHSAITVRSSSALSKADTLKLIEKALIEQAGVVITPLGDKRISVTINDALPIKKAKE